MTVRPLQHGSECSHIRGILNRVGDRWSLLAIAQLVDGPKRFGDLQRHLTGISHRMLTLTLRLLEREGVVSRRELSTVPAGVEYGLTPLGQTLTEPVRALSAWARVHGEDIRKARQLFDTATKTPRRAKTGRRSSGG